MNEPITVEFSISLEDFQYILKDDLTDNQIEKMFNDPIIREIIQDKLGYNQYTYDDLTDTLCEYLEQFKI